MSENSDNLLIRRTESEDDSISNSPSISSLNKFRDSFSIGSSNASTSSSSNTRKVKKSGKFVKYYLVFNLMLYILKFNIFKYF